MIQTSLGWSRTIIIILGYLLIYQNSGGALSRNVGDDAQYSF